MKAGQQPQQAADAAVRRIADFYPCYVGALVVSNAAGEVAAACHGWNFQYSILNSSLAAPLVVHVAPLQTEAKETCASGFSGALPSLVKRLPSQGKDSWGAA